jgi:hypothetical protein
LFKGGPEQGWEQHRLTLSQGFDGGGDGGGHLRPLNDEWINPAWSCHAPTLPLLGSSWKRIRINDADLHGVALAAIQGLNEKVKEKDAKISELEKRLSDLERTVQSLAEKK